MSELALLGIVIGSVSGFFGIGGGTILVPVLVHLGYDVKTAIGIAVVQMVFASVFGSYVNYKNGKLKINDGIALGLGGFLGATQSGWIVQAVPEEFLLYTFTAALVFTLFRFLRAPVVPSGPCIRSRPLLFGLGFGVGMVSISIGVGGGLFLTPILVGFMRYDIKQAVSMGLFFVVFSSVSGFLSMMHYGVVDLKTGIVLGIGSLLGVYLGTTFSYRVNRRVQKWLLMALYILLLGLILNKLLG